MKKIIVSFTIFLSMLGCMFFSVSYLSKVNRDLIKLSDTLEKQVSNQQWKEAYATSMTFTEKWKKYSSVLSVYVNHLEIDNIDNELWKLSQYTKCENKDESLASLHVIKFFIDHIFNLEKITWQNIF